MNNEIDLKYILHNSKNKKYIGWGTGAAFQFYNKILPIPLDYLVDNNCEKWETYLEGYEIKSPKCLLEEDVNDIIISISKVNVKM